MKYTKFKTIAESEGLVIKVLPDELVVDDQLGYRLATIDLNQIMTFTILSKSRTWATPKVIEAIAEFAATPWIEREVPDKGDLDDEDDD